MPQASRYIYPRPGSDIKPAGDDIERGHVEDIKVGLKVTISEHVIEDCIDGEQDVVKSVGQ